MGRQIPTQIRRRLDFVREQTPELHSADDFFAAVLELAEYVAAHERIIAARRREFEPDHLAARIFGSPESAALRAVDEILGGLSPDDVERIEAVLTRLERLHGRAKAAPPNHRLLLDGALLGEMAFAYTRRYREVLATRAVHDRKTIGHLLPELLLRVDAVFERGKPAYLWRLGPEFGTDRNVDYLLDRGDEFILRGLYRSRARRLAKGVMHWTELAGGVEIGENWQGSVHRDPARVLVLRWREGRRTAYGSLVTNLANVPWEEIYRFYMNRSCKSSVDVPQRASSSKRLAVSFMILALFTYRNFRTWASDPPTSSTSSVAVSQAAETARSLSLIQNHRPMVFDRMAQVIEYLHVLSGGESTLPSVFASPNRMNYQIQLADGVKVPLMADGKVIHVEGDAVLGFSVTVDHGLGVTTTYGNLESLTPGMVVGATFPKGQEMGSLAGGERLHFSANLAQKFLDKSLLPSVADLLTEGGSLLFDPLSILTAYAPAGSDPGSTDLPGSEDRQIPRPSSLTSADLYRLASPDLASETIFIATALVVEELDLTPLPEVFDDDIEVDVIGEDIS